MSTITAPAHTVHTLLRADGFSCPSCVGKIQRQLRALPGVSAATVHFASARIEVDHDPQRTTIGDLVAAVEQSGYTARPSLY